MPDYETKLETINISGISLNITSLKDRHQFHDPNKEAEKLGISDSKWPISGLIWPSSLILAKIVSQLDLQNLRILEVGCGIGIASLVAAYKNADITASDYHPLVRTLLSKNTENNRLKDIEFAYGNWNYPISNHGRFDLIIGSDILYEREHTRLVSNFIDCHLNDQGTAIIIDPKRRYAKKISKTMQNLGFQHEVTSMDSSCNIKKDGYFNKYTFCKL